MSASAGCRAASHDADTQAPRPERCPPCPKSTSRTGDWPARTIEISIVSPELPKLLNA
jgi:hypothetical protein